jgi:hypothetical protein
MLIAAFALSLPVIILNTPLDGRLPGTHDATLHLMRLINAAFNLENGNLIPRWGTHLHFGFGYPLGNFYAPGWHIVGAFPVALGVPAVSVWLIVQTIAIALYPVGGYLFARLFAGRAAALLGAAVCLYAPFRFYEIFVQGNLSQFIAMGLIAWVLWAFGRCAMQPGVGRILVAALTFAVLIMMHHPTAALIIPFTGVCAVFAALVAPEIGARKGQLFSVLAAYTLGLLLSTTYWLPAFAEVQYVNVRAAAEQFQIQDNFIPLSDLLGAAQPPDRGSLNMPYTFGIGQVTLLLAGLGGVAALRARLSRWQRAFIFGGLIVALMCGYMATYPSLWLWERIPGASLILFPWRLLGLIAVMLVPAAACLIEAIPKRWQPGTVCVGVTALLLTSLPLMFSIYPDLPDQGAITPATSIRYEITSGNLGGVSNNEYLPRWASKRPDFAPCPECYNEWKWQIFVNDRTLPTGVKVVAAPSELRRVSRFDVNAPAPFRLELRQLYFSGWSATLDGQPIPIQITEPYGLIALDVPAGEHRVQVWYAGTTVQHIADIASLCGVMIGAVLLIMQIRRYKPAASMIQEANRFGKAVTMSAIVVTIVLGAFIQPHTTLFRGQGTESAPPGMAHRTDLIFTDSSGEPQIRLLGYTLSASEARHGEWVRVRLWWQALRPISQAWRTKLSLSDPATGAAWADSDHAAPGGFAATAWTTDKYVIDDHILRITGDTTPYIGELTIQLISDQGAELQVQGTTRTKLDSIRVAEIGRAELLPDVRKVDIVFGETIRLRAIGLARNPDQKWKLRLFWEVLRAPDQEYVLMLHQFGAGADIGATDQPPIPSYPTQHWRAGQFLESIVNFKTLPNADALFIGLYRRADVQRLPVKVYAGDLRTADGGVFIPLAEIR